jgi:hypothetical protein
MTAMASKREKILPAKNILLVFTSNFTLVPVK